MLEPLAIPIVGAPLAGGASTPALAAAVSGAGGLGFLASGYKTPDAMAADIAATRELTAAPFGVNVFAFTPTEAAPGGARGVPPQRRRPRRGAGRAAHRRRPLRGARSSGCWPTRCAVVSFTFGCPRAGARGAASGRPGARSGSPSPTPTRRARPPRRAPTRSSCRASRPAGTAARSPTSSRATTGCSRCCSSSAPPSDVPLVATGGIATGARPSPPCSPRARAPRRSAPPSCAARRPARAEVHRDALARPGPHRADARVHRPHARAGSSTTSCASTRPTAPHAYPAVHHVTAPIRAPARAAGRSGAAEPVGRPGPRADPRHPGRGAGARAARGGARRGRRGCTRACPAERVPSLASDDPGGPSVIKKILFVAVLGPCARRDRGRQPHPRPPLQQLRVARILADDPRQGQEDPLQRAARSTAPAAPTSCSATTARTSSTAAGARTSCGATARAAPASRPASATASTAARGNDFIYGSHGRNVIFGGPGNDAISVHYGRGFVDCGPGRDIYHVAEVAQEGLQVPQLREGRLPHRAPARRRPEAAPLAGALAAVHRLVGEAHRLAGVELARRSGRHADARAAATSRRRRSSPAGARAPRRSTSATRSAAAAGVWRSRIANSSPPKRATTSVSRSRSRSTAPTWRSSSSPPACP